MSDPPSFFAPTIFICLRRAPLNGVSATHTGGRSRANHARSHPNTRARRHILAAKPRALRNSPTPLALRNSPTPLEPCRQEPAPRRLPGVYKPGLHRPAVPCTPVGLPEPRTRRQVPNQRPVLRSRSPELYKLGPMRQPLKIPKRLLRERELYSSPISLVVCVVRTCRARTFNEDRASWFEVFARTRSFGQICA